jgi:hypothetical protein
VADIWRIFYALDGTELGVELPQSKAGLYFGKPFTESTTIYILMSNGRIDLDHFQTEPIDYGHGSTVDHIANY